MITATVDRDFLAHSCKGALEIYQDRLALADQAVIMAFQDYQEHTLVSDGFFKPKRKLTYSEVASRLHCLDYATSYEGDLWWEHERACSYRNAIEKQIDKVEKLEYLCSQLETDEIALDEEALTLLLLL